jgi:ribosomal-protein-serine acetyltransferase
MEKVLQDSFLTLRQYTPADVIETFSAVRESLPELLPYMPWCHANYSIEETRTFIEERAEKWDKGISYDFAITDSKDGSYIGGCGLDHIDLADRFCNLGYWVRSSRVNQGIATNATLLLLKFGFNELKLNRIEIVVEVENKASQRVAEKVGAKREGIMRNRFLLHGKPHNAVMFSLIPGDIMNL